MSDDVLLIDRDGPVTRLTLNRPKARNALDSALLHALAEALGRAAEDPAVRTILLTGAGGAFCSGADLKAAATENAFDRLDGIMDTYHRVIRAIAGAPKPVIAAVDGAAVGFGCDLALACDMRLLSTEGYLQERFVKIGLMPDGGGTFWLPRLVGLGKAMEIMMLGDTISAEQALRLGLANRVIPAGSLAEESMKLAQKLAKGPPLAYAGIKQAVRASLGGTIDTALDLEKRGQLRCLTSSDCMEGVAAWVQKREPVFQGK
jgi:enoyl-CoA hydratase/carnithine racemase